MHVWSGNESEWFTPPGHYGELLTSLVVPWSAGATFSVQRTDLAPGAGKALHTHDDAAQLYVVVRGQLRFDTGEEQFTLGPDQAVLFEVGDPHGIHNAADEPGAVVVFTTRVEAQG